MRKRGALPLLAIAVTFIALGAAGQAAGECAGHSIVDEMAALERRFEAGAFEATGLHDLRARIDDLAARSGTERAAGDAKAVISALNRLIFTEIGILPTQDLKDPNNLLLSRVLDRKRGYCVGIAALYLALAERLDLPIHAVATPSHVFLRFDDGTTRVNIESMQGGREITDEQYLRDQKIPLESIRNGVFMRNLTTDEFLAQVHNNLGVIYSEKEDHERAANEYETAIDLDPRLSAARYNYGSDLLRMEEFRRAARILSRSLRLYPTDAWTLNNRGRAYLKMGKLEKARRDFEAALRIDPMLQQARSNLEEIRSRTTTLPD